MRQHVHMSKTRINRKSYEGNNDGKDYDDNDGNSGCGDEDVDYGDDNDDDDNDNNDDDGGKKICSLEEMLLIRFTIKPFYW